MAVAPSWLKDGRCHQFCPPEAAAIGDQGDGPCGGSARGGGGATAVATTKVYGLPLQREGPGGPRGRRSVGAGGDGPGALCRGRGVAGTRAEVGAREEAGAGSRIGATVAGVPRAADSSEIGMGAMKSGLAMEYAAAVEKGEFWVTHLFAVRYPNRPMHLAYGFGLLETV